MHSINAVTILLVIFLAPLTHLKAYGFTVFRQRRGWEVRHESAAVQMVERQDPFFVEKGRRRRMITDLATSRERANPSAFLVKGKI